MAEKSKITDVCANNSVDVELHENQTSCDNCESKHHVSYEFCPFCGQNTNDKLTVGLLFYNTIANYFSFDAGDCCFLNAYLGWQCWCYSRNFSFLGKFCLNYWC